MKLRRLLVTGLHAAYRVGEQVSIKLTRTSLLGTEAEAPEPTTYFPAFFSPGDSCWGLDRRTRSQNGQSQGNKLVDRLPQEIRQLPH